MGGLFWFWKVTVAIMMGDRVTDAHALRVGDVNNAAPEELKPNDLIDCGLRLGPDQVCVVDRSVRVRADTDQRVEWLSLANR